ncbi:MAG: LuxR C-terminal-related transcriptional regulator [Vulcanimicrobiaceae bacterium]
MSASARLPTANVARLRDDACAPGLGQSAPVEAVPPADLARRRAIPAFYAVDNELRVHFSCGVPRSAYLDRLPPPVEQIVRNLLQARSADTAGAIGIEGDTIVRIAESYSSTQQLCGIVVEKLRTRDPLQEAIGRFGITPRETEVLRLLLLGAATATIARQLSIAETTAADHVRRIATKTGSRGRGQIVARVLGFL